MKRIIKKIKALTMIVIAMPLIVTVLISILGLIKRKKYIKCCRKPECKIENMNDNDFEMM